MWKSSAFLFFIIIPAFLFEYLLFHLTNNKPNIYNKSHKTAGFVQRLSVRIQTQFVSFTIYK